MASKTNYRGQSLSSSSGNWLNLAVSSLMKRTKMEDRTGELTQTESVHQFPDDEDRGGVRKFCLLAIQPPDATASPGIFYRSICSLCPICLLINVKHGYKYSVRYCTFISSCACTLWPRTECGRWFHLLYLPVSELERGSVPHPPTHPPSVLRQ
jgi:hypothetical protein